MEVRMAQQTDDNRCPLLRTGPMAKNYAIEWLTGLFRLAFVIVNNLYCIPTYVIWMVLLYPLEMYSPELYWRIEGKLFHWLLTMVASWSWSAGYKLVEMGENIGNYIDKSTLIIANHQSTADVPFLMSAFASRENILPNLTWIMDKMFKYTNFGIVSAIHGDFFIESGRTKRDDAAVNLVHYLRNEFSLRKRKWIVLFPEGGFLRKRKEVSQRYARKLGLPFLQNVSLPRVGALNAVMQTCGPVKTTTHNIDHCSNNIVRLQYLVDITIAYPNGKPLGFDNIVFANEPPCDIILYYRVYPCAEVPVEEEMLTTWIYDRFVEKEDILKDYYKTGVFRGDQSRGECAVTNRVDHDMLRIIILNLFFLASTYLHYRMFLYVISLLCM